MTRGITAKEKKKLQKVRVQAMRVFHVGRLKADKIAWIVVNGRGK